MSNPFTDHTNDIGRGYFGHFALALGVLGNLFVATFVFLFMHFPLFCAPTPQVEL